MYALAIAASAELIVSLALAWLGALAMYLKPPILTRIFTRPFYLIKTHIDFLLMSLLLFTFYLLAVPLPTWIITCTIIGSITNPMLFLVMSANANPSTSASSPFGIFSIISFVIATAGFGGTAVVLLLHFLQQG